MINKITAITLHTTALGEQMAITYSSIDDNGNVISQNKRAETVILDADSLSAVDVLKKLADSKIS